MYFCNLHGFPLDDVPPGIQAPGFEFTAYLKSDYFAELMAENALDLAGMDPAVEAALSASRGRCAIIFASELKSKHGASSNNGKKTIFYPYQAQANEIQRKERQVFDITALNVATYLPRFQEEAEPKAKQFQLRLLRHAIETGPEDALRFLN